MNKPAFDSNASMYAPLSVTGSPKYASESFRTMRPLDTGHSHLISVVNRGFASLCPRFTSLKHCAGAAQYMKALHLV